MTLKENTYSYLWRLFLFLVFGFFAVHLGNFYYENITVPNADMPGNQGRLQLHEEILDKTSVAPFRYRILYPYLTEGISRTVLAFKDGSKLSSLLITWHYFDILLMLTMFGCLYLYCRRFYPRHLAFLGVLVVCLTMKVMMKDHGYAPWYFIEPSLIALTLYFGLDRRVWIILGLTILGRLNRDSGALIPLFYLIVNFPFYLSRRDRWKELVPLFMAAILTELFVRTYQGWGAPYVHPLDWNYFWARMEVPGLLRKAFHNWVDFFGLFWICIFIGRYTVKGYLLRSLIPMVIIVAGHLRVGAWHEVMLLNPMYAVFLTVGLDPLLRLEKKALSWDGRFLSVRRGIEKLIASARQRYGNELSDAS